MERDIYNQRKIKPILSTLNLTKKFKDKKILNSITMDVYPNTITGIIGQNGAGKTTLLRTILGLYNPTEGSVDKTVDDSELSMLLENDFLCEKKTGFQNIEHFSSYFKIDTKNIILKVEKYSKILNLFNNLDLRVSSYSKGMKRKLSLLIVLLRDTKIIILDEPTSGVDPISRVEIRKLLSEIRDEGRTIIITSHDLVEIQKLSDNIILLDDGSLIKLFEGNINHEDLERAYFKLVSRGRLYEDNA